MKKTIIFALIVLLTLFSATAQTPELFQLPTDDQQMEQIDIPLGSMIGLVKNIDPSELPSIPEQIPFLGADENVNFYIHSNDGTETVLGVRLKDRKVTQITDKIEDWTLKVDINENTLIKLMASQDPINDIKAALKSKEIKIQGRTLGKKIKVGFLKMGLGLAGLFT